MNKYLVYLLIIFHSVGVAGLSSDFAPFFIQFTPGNLLLTLAIVLVSFNKVKSWKAWVALAIAYVFGFGAEYIGVHTGLLFGDYAYGNGLGWKWREIPLTIGMNWAMLIAVTRSMANKMTSNKWLQALVAAGLMVVLDLWMEPVAPKLNFWEFEGGIAPFSNYVGWFAVALVIHTIGNFFKAQTWDVKTDVAVYTIQSMFFLVLVFA